MHIVAYISIEVKNAVKSPLVMLISVFYCWLGETGLWYVWLVKVYVK